jgi:Tol biopolymer transport system component
MKSPVRLSVCVTSASLRAPARAVVLAIGGLIVSSSDALASGTTARVSIDSSGVEGDLRSGFTEDGVSISGDGRYVAFDSDASNLVPNDTNGRSDVFVHDREAGTTIRVSVAAGGVESNGPSAKSSISATGRYIAFRSSATNLVPGDTNGVDDVFVHDHETGVTIRASVDSSGGEANGSSSSVTISIDGRFVAFASLANNLVTGDTNGVRDIFLHDRDADGNGVFDEAGGIETTRISVDSSGNQGNGPSRAAAISSDGRFVVFDSDATNLVAGDTNGVADVFIRDRLTGTTSRVSIDSLGNEGNGPSLEPVVSGNGRFVVYQSDATNLVADDTNGVTDIFVHNRSNGVTVRVTVNLAGEEANLANTDPAISPGGRFLAFRSLASNLVAGDTNGRADAFVFDRQNGSITRISVGSDGSEGDGDSSDPSVSSDGRIAVFSSLATSFAAMDTNLASDVFVRDPSDTLAPRLECPPSVTAECTSAEGTVVEFTVTVSDNCDPAPAVICAPPSGSVFPYGVTMVSCTATDASGNETSCSFEVDVGGVALVAVLPATGSESGNDLVKVRGCGFTTVADTIVTVGGAEATLVEVTSAEIKLRTPAGAGVADVAVTNSNGTAMLAGAFTYLDPVLAALLGNVNVALGDREDVLTINGSAGDSEREIEIAAGSPISVHMASPSSRPDSAFVLYGWVGLPSAATLKEQRFGLGTTVFPTPVTRDCQPQPAVIFNNLGFHGVFGAPRFPSTRAPSVVFARKQGLGRPMSVTLQGFIRDDGSQIPERVSITNGIVLHVLEP